VEGCALLVPERLSGSKPEAKQSRKAADFLVCISHLLSGFGTGTGAVRRWCKACHTTHELAEFGDKPMASVCAGVRMRRVTAEVPQAPPTAPLVADRDVVDVLTHTVTELHSDVTEEAVFRLGERLPLPALTLADLDLPPLGFWSSRTASIILTFDQLQCQKTEKDPVWALGAFSKLAVAPGGSFKMWQTEPKDVKLTGRQRICVSGRDPTVQGITFTHGRITVPRGLDEGVLFIVEDGAGASDALPRAVFISADADLRWEIERLPDCFSEYNKHKLLWLISIALGPSPVSEYRELVRRLAAAVPMPRLLYRLNNADEYAWLESTKMYAVLHHITCILMALVVVYANYDALFIFPKQAIVGRVDGRTEWQAMYVHSLLWLINVFLSLLNILLLNTRHYYSTLVATACFRNIFTVLLQSLYANWVLPAGTVVAFDRAGGATVMAFTFICALYPLKFKHRAYVLLAKNAQMWLPHGPVKVAWPLFCGMLDVRIADLMFICLIIALSARRRKVKTA